MAERERGRPPKRPEDKRENRLVVKLKDAERIILEEAAAPDVLTVWARDVLLRAAKRRRR